jgi:hypothetical protein
MTVTVLALILRATPFPGDNRPCWSPTSLAWMIALSQGRQTVPAHQDVFATVRSTALLSRALRLCEAFGLISRSPVRPSRVVSPLMSRTRPRSTVALLTVVPVLYLGHLASSLAGYLVGGFFPGLAGTTFAIGVPSAYCSWRPPPQSPPPSPQP